MTKPPVEDPWLDELKRRLQLSPELVKMRREEAAVAEHFRRRAARALLLRRLAIFGIPAAAIIALALLGRLTLYQPDTNL